MKFSGCFLFTVYNKAIHRSIVIHKHHRSFLCVIMVHNTDIFVYLFVLMVFNATFNNISIISWRSVLLVEETGGPGENQRPVASH
jgi:hypothetical protein